MGTDISVHLELLHTETEVWHHFGSYRPNRWYPVFGYLAGVRGEGPPVAPPRGIPSDATELTKWDWEMFGGHTPSHLTRCEMLMVQDLMRRHVDAKWTMTRWMSGGCHDGAYCYQYLFGGDLVPPEWDWAEWADARYVFWFDC